MRGDFVSAETTAVADFGPTHDVHVQNPKHLASDASLLSRIGVAQRIDGDPRG